MQQQKDKSKGITIFALYFASSISDYLRGFTNMNNKRNNDTKIMHSINE